MLTQINCEFFLARPAGLEPATYGFEVRRSIQLSYGRKGIRSRKNNREANASPVPTLVPDHNPRIARTAADCSGIGFLEWGERWDLNPRPQRPQPCALPTELRPPHRILVQVLPIEVNPPCAGCAIKLPGKKNLTIGFAAGGFHTACG